MMFPVGPAFVVGRFLVSPWSKRTEAGDYEASISLRSGQGSASHDRVFRFSPRFNSPQSALAYAAHEGRCLALAP